MRAGLGAAALLAGLTLASCGGGHAPRTAPAGSAGTGVVVGVGGFAGAALEPPVPAPAFSLRDQDGRRASLAEYRGHVVVLAFLGTRCAPGCVLVAQQIRGALDDVSRPPAVLLVSVSPAADTPARVRRFLGTVSLAGRARYLAAPAAALPALWRGYRVTTPSAGRAAFERAIQVVLVDGQGRERVLFEPEQLTPEALAHDIGKLDGVPPGR